MLRPLLPALTAVLGLPLLTIATPAQCTNLWGGSQVTAWNWTFVNDDGISTNHIPIAFNFPIAGAAASTFNHLRVGTNGWLLLTDGTNSPGLPLASSGGYGSTDNSSNGLGGAAGDYPLLAPFWGDLLWSAGNGNGVFVASGYSSCRVTWRNVRDYNAPASAAYSFGVELFPSGEVRYHYGPGVDNASTQWLTNLVGLSARNSQQVPAAADLFPGMTSTAGGMVWQDFPVGAFDGEATSLVLTPIGNSWSTSVCSGNPAQTVSYGSGCYDLPRSGFYREFADAAAASASLQGNVMLLTPTGNGYQSYWLAGAASATFVPPTAAATPLNLDDDDLTSVWLPTPFPTPNGLVNSFQVYADGIVAMNYAYGQFFDNSPSGAEFVAASAATFCSWHDYDPSEPGSGQVKSEFVDSTLCLTWHDVENHSSPAAANRSTVQFQFDLTSGSVQIVWLQIDGDTTSANGSAHLVGVKGGGPVADAGSIQLDVGPGPSSYWRQPIELASNTPLVYGSTASFVTLRVPELQPGSGVYVAMHIMSTSQNPGTDLGVIGAPGCLGYVGSLDFAMPMIGSTSVLTSSLPLPNQGISGLQLFSQSVALVSPTVVANPQNVLGLVTSNGLRHTLNYY